MALQAAKPFNIDPDLLDTSSAPSDRFTYLAHFVIYGGPANGGIDVPPYRAAYVARIAALMPKEIRETVLKKYPGVLKHANEIADSDKQGKGAQRPRRDVEEGAHARREIDTLLDRLEEHVKSGADAADVITRLQAVTRTRQALLSVSVPPRPQGADVPPITSPNWLSQSQQLSLLLMPELGFLYLDRTRITPIGFAVGEHLYTLSLAPGEEVTIEQQTYSKRETTFEDLQDRESTLDLEISSALTGELSEGLNQELSRLSKDSESNGVRVSGEIYGINIAAGPSTTTSVDDGDRITSTSSVKQTHTSSTKVAAKYRTQHKTTFKVSTENRFETTAKRVVRNPNTYTPIDLLYFKILQRVRLSQERYGIRLCWSPAVRDPAGAYFARLQALKDAILAAASKAGAGPRPTPPDPPAALPPVTLSTVMAADKFDWFNGSQSNDYTVRIPAPSGYVWDGDASFVSSSLQFTFTGMRPGGAQVRSPSNDGTGMTCIVHVGVENRVWQDATGWHIENIGTASFQVKANFIPTNVAGNDEYNTKLAAWRTADQAWQAQDAKAKADALATAQSDWDTQRAQELAQLNPMFETFGVLISQMFPAQYRDDIGEIDLWERLFDWSNASLKLYPAWWNGGQLREPSLPPTHFVNASWARLFLPVRIGSEAEALRWIFQLAGASPTTQLIQGIVDQIRNYRVDHFGSDTEIVMTTTAGPCPSTTQSYTCMGSWEDTLPTDGTHIEVLQSTTLAADDDARQRLTDAQDRRTAELERLRRGTEMLTDVNVATTDPVTPEVTIKLIDRSEDTPQGS